MFDCFKARDTELLLISKQQQKKNYEITLKNMASKGC